MSQILDRVLYAPTRRNLITGIIVLGVAPAIVRAGHLMAVKAMAADTNFWIEEVWAAGRVEYWTSTGNFVIGFDAGRRLMRQLLVPSHDHDAMAAFAGF